MTGLVGLSPIDLAGGAVVAGPVVRDQVAAGEQHAQPGVVVGVVLAVWGVGAHLVRGGGGGGEGITQKKMCG